MSKITDDVRLNPVWHRMLYSCTHMVTVGVKGLNSCHVAGMWCGVWQHQRCRRGSLPSVDAVYRLTACLRQVALAAVWHRRPSRPPPRCLASTSPARRPPPGGPCLRRPNPATRRRRRLSRAPGQPGRPRGPPGPRRRAPVEGRGVRPWRRWASVPRPTRRLRRRWVWWLTTRTHWVVFRSAVHDRERSLTRSHSRCQSINQSIGGRLLNFKGSQLWNRLPKYLINIKSHQLFKKNYGIN